MDTRLDIKVTPPDGTWSTARKLIETIAKDKRLKELQVAGLVIEVDGIFSDAKSKGNNVANNFNYINQTVNARL